MANSPDVEDDDFRDLYKEYTGPPRSTGTNAEERLKANKRSHAGSDDEEEPRDPNAVPTDFTSREAKVWEAKSKATERNWKKRKEEEMICKICGESGHFTQGCPSTLGANRKTQDFFERVPARDKHVKALFTEKVINKIEKDIGCKLKMEEKFLIVSGKDRLILSKGVDAVHKLIKEGGNRKGSSSPHMARSRSPEQSPARSRLGRSESEKSLPSTHDPSQFPHRFGRQEKVIEHRVREDLQKLSRGSPQAYGHDGGRGRPSLSKSPARPSYSSNPYNSYDSHNQRAGVYKNDGWNTERREADNVPAGRGSDVPAGRKFEYPAFPQTLEELELEYKREAMDLGRIRDKEEDEENYKHREAVRDIRENYMKKLSLLRGVHAKQWEEFLHLDSQRRQQMALQKIPNAPFGGYKQQQPNYSDYDGSSGDPRYGGSNLPMDSRGRYPNAQMENYPSTRSHETYGDFQLQKRDDYGKAYNRY